MVVVAPDSPQRLRQWALPCPAIADPEGTVLRALGQVVDWWRLGRMPGVLVVDRQGMVRWRHQGRSMRDVPTVQQWLAVVRRIQAGEPSARIPRDDA